MSTVEQIALHRVAKSNIRHEIQEVLDEMKETWVVEGWDHKELEELLDENPHLKDLKEVGV